MGHAQEAGEGVITSVGPGGGVALEVACLAVVVAQVTVSHGSEPRSSSRLDVLRAFCLSACESSGYATIYSRSSNFTPSQHFQNCTIESHANPYITHIPCMFMLFCIMLFCIWLFLVLFI